MKTLYKIIVVIFVILLIAVVIAAGALFTIYQAYLKPQPVEFEFSRPVENMTEVQIVKVTDIRSGAPKYDEVVENIADTESFLSDFKALACSKGVPLSIITKLDTIDGLTGIKITYADGTFEVITAYGNINSDQFTKAFVNDLTPEKIFEMEFYFFDETAFAQLINQYSTK